MNNITIPVNKQLETSEIQVGACIYCGQTRQLETSGLMTNEQLDKAATEKCDCEQAGAAKTNRTKKQTAINNIHAVLTDKYPEATEILENNVDHLLNGRITSIAINSPSGAVIKMQYTAKGNIKISRNIKLEAVLEG